MTEKNSRQGSKLQGRARRYAHVVSALFQRQDLSGSLKIASRGARHLSLSVKLNDPTMLDKALKLAEPMALASGSENVLSQRARGLVSYQFQLNPGFWEFYTRSDLPDTNAVGLAEQRRPVTFDFAYPHSLIAGTTGSGKSVALKTILLSLVSTHKPNQLGLVLVDPNRDHDDFENVAHLTMPIANNTKEIRNALSYSNQVLVNRIENNIKSDRLLVVGIDEAQGENVLGDKANFELVRNLAKQGRKYGVHLLLSTQKPSHKDLGGILDNLLNRFIGLLSDGQLSARLTGHSGLAAHKLTGAGDFLHVVGGDANRFQVAQCQQKDFDDLVRAEIAEPVVEDHDIVILPEEKATGRPQTIVDPKICASYFWHNPQNISISMAKSSFGLGRTGHNLHKDFITKFSNEIKRLRGKK